jgi:hypothetical protein
MAALEADVIIVSGLPRSGTSLMMQMLQAGGIEIVTDNIRAADTDNPRGYYEFEQVKKIENRPGMASSHTGQGVQDDFAVALSSARQRELPDYFYGTGSR